MYFLLWATMTECHRLGGVNNRNLFLPVLEAGKSKTEVPAASIPGKDSLPGLQMVTFLLCPAFGGDRMISLSSSS